MTRPTRVLIGYVLLVCATTTLTSFGVVSATTLAESPEKLARGNVWLLLTSGLIVDRPVVVSLLSLAFFAAVTTFLCGARSAMWAALLGHVLSTLLVYVIIALMRVGQPYSFQDAIRNPDFGVSAVCAAWLGLVAGSLWSSRSGVRSRAGVVAACTVAAGVAYVLHPSHDAIAAEHPVAFAVGLLIATPQLRQFLARRFRVALLMPLVRFGLDPVLAVILGATGAAGAIAVVPTALATVTAVVRDQPASVSRCIASWNGSWTAPRGAVGGVGPLFAYVEQVPRRRRARTYRDCRLVFYGGTATLAVHGRWSHGRVTRWSFRRLAGPPTAPANAAVVRASGVRLLAQPTWFRR